MRLLDRASVRDQFARTLSEVDAPTPWTSREGDPGCVFDAQGYVVAVVDQHNQRSNREAHRLATLICLAVNACAVRVTEEETAS